MQRKPTQILFDCFMETRIEFTIKKRDAKSIAFCVFRRQFLVMIIFFQILFVLMLLALLYWLSDINNVTNFNSFISSIIGCLLLLLLMFIMFLIIKKKLIKRFKDSDTLRFQFKKQNNFLEIYSFNSKKITNIEIANISQIKRYKKWILLKFDNEGFFPCPNNPEVASFIEQIKR